MNGFALLNAFHLARYRVVQQNQRLPITQRRFKNRAIMLFHYRVIKYHNLHMREIRYNPHPFR